REPQHGLGVRASDGPPHGRTEIVEIAIEPAHPAHLAGTVNFGLGALGEAEIEGAMAATHRLRFGARGEAALRVLAHRLEEAIARLALSQREEHERLLHERGEEVDDAVGRHAVSSADERSRLRGPASGERREPSKDRLLLGGEEGMTPLERCAERL